jgi:hypothetical protein
VRFPASNFAAAAAKIWHVERIIQGGRPMFGVRYVRPLLGALLPVALAAQELPRRVEPERLWKLDTGG